MAGKFYKGEFKSIDVDDFETPLGRSVTKRDCLVVYPPNNPANKAIKVMPYFKVVAAYLGGSHMTGNCYVHNISRYGWTDDVTPKMLDALNVPYKEVEGGNGREDIRVLNHVDIANQFKEYKDIFDHISIRDFELDSSD